MSNLSELKNAVADETNLHKSGILLLNNIAAAVKRTAGDKGAAHFSRWRQKRGVS